MTTLQPNPFLLAADDSPQLLPLLRTNPSLASAQDDHGYSLVHAAASYNHLDLLRLLVTELQVPVDLKDEDGETALFVVETVECAKVLVEELHAAPTVRGEENKTAREKIEEDGDFPEVAEYLRSLESGFNHIQSNGISTNNRTGISVMDQSMSLPDGVSINVGTMALEDLDEEVVDPDFRRRIEELAAREDFQSEEGQQQLRELITEVLRGQIHDERDVRQRTG